MPCYQYVLSPCSIVSDSYYYIRACDEISELLHCLRTWLSQPDREQAGIPDCLRLPIRVIVIGKLQLQAALYTSLSEINVLYKGVLNVG